MTNHAGPVVAQRDGLTAIDCRACGFIHLDWLPAQADLDRYYAEEFWATKGGGWLQKYEAERDWIDAKNGDILEVLEYHTLSRTLLDVGSGYGFFLRQAWLRGWKVSGIELSYDAVRYSETLLGHGPVWCGSWDAYPWPTKFDALTAFWLLEHLPDPMAFLRGAHSRLYSGGTLVLAVPNEWNLYQQEASKRGLCLENFQLHATHTNYFTPASLGNLLGRAGFRVVDMLTTYPIELHLLAGRDYTRDEAVGADCHALVRQHDLTLTRDARLAEARSRARQSVGRDLLVVAKPEG